MHIPSVFRIGDRVRLRNALDRIPPGTLGTVVICFTRSSLYDVQFDRYPGARVVDGSSLALALPEPTQRRGVMNYLVKNGMNYGLAMHIPDATGMPICGTRIKRATWRIEERSSTGAVVCWHCRRIQTNGMRC